MNIDTKSTKILIWLALSYTLPVIFFGDFTILNAILFPFFTALMVYSSVYKAEKEIVSSRIDWSLMRFSFFLAFFLVFFGISMSSHNNNSFMLYIVNNTHGDATHIKIESVIAYWLSVVLSNGLNVWYRQLRYYEYREKFTDVMGRVDTVAFERDKKLRNLI